MHHLKDLPLKTTRRVASISILATLGASVLFLSAPGLDAKPAKFAVAAPAPELVEQLQGGLKKPIATSSIEDLERALKSAVAANPEQAPNYVAIIFKSNRRRVCSESGRIVTAAIQGLGKIQKPELIFGIVRNSIILDEECAQVILQASIKASPRSMAYKIVGVAVGSLQHPGDFVRDGKNLSHTTLAEALAASTLEAFPDLDPALVNGAINGGLIGFGDGLEFAGNDTPIFNASGGGSQGNNPNPDEPTSE